MIPKTAAEAKRDPRMTSRKTASRVELREMHSAELRGSGKVTAGQQDCQVT